MSKKTGRIGGFAAYNSGSIENCYSITRLKSKGYISGGFTGENTGAVSNSYFYGRIKHLTGGFTGEDKGNTENNCYFFHHEREGSKKLEKMSDPIRGQRLKEIKDDEDVQKLGFDTTEIWEYSNGETPVRFIADKWLFNVEASEKFRQYQRQEEDSPQVKVITKAEELRELAKKINEGDRELADAYIRLDNDISLGGEEWIPIGRDRANGFTGLFDGAGYTIRQFKVSDSKTENKGFFGFLEGGEVYNLSVDCNLKGGTCAGGIAAQNEGGVIGCCSAVIEIKGKNGFYGGLVGRNAGIIFESYSAGRILAAVILWWLFFVPLLLILLFLHGRQRILPTFAPVPYDKDVVPIPDEPVSPNKDGNFVSFQFKQEIDVNKSTGHCNFEFKNPGNSNHNIVVQLQFTDAQAVRIMGSTGRSEEEQKRLESTPEYDPETYRTVLAESGAIQPGYQLDSLRLTEQENGATIPDGKYNAMIYLVFYDIDTNNRAMLESQLPVEITVH